MVSVLDLPTIVESRVDWLSMSTRDMSGCRALLDWRDSRFGVLAEEGFSERTYSAHGYQYRQRGQVAIAVGRSDVLCQLSGAEAQASFVDCVKWATNVSRVDLAVTGRYDSPRHDVAQVAYHTVGRSEGRRPRRAELTLILSQDRGDTLYVGSRASDQRGRVYDKERESGVAEYERCWRWEVQYRRAPAQAIAQALKATPDAAEAIEATVAGWFTRRGIGAPVVTSADPLPSEVGRPTPDDDRWLAWARRCVRPRAELMAKKYGWRFVAESLCGRIATFEGWESLVNGLEIELVED